MNDNYTGQSAIYAGMSAPSALPAWRQNLAVNTWTTVASVGTISAINPRNNPAINPNFPNKAEWEAGGSVTEVVAAWCGGTYDYQHHNFWLPLSGGHGDYAGNEPYAIDMGADVPAWRMVRPPTGALPDAIITNDGQENSGVYADGRPRAIHSYNKCVFIPNQGPAVVPQGSTSWSAAGGTMRPIIIDHATGEMKRFGTSQGVHTPGAYSGGGSCYDSLRDAVWIRGIGSGRFQRYNVATDTWTREASNSQAVSGSSALCYIESHDCILWFHQTFANGFAVLDCATGVITQPQVTGVCVGVAPAPNGGVLRPHGLMQPHDIGGNRFAFWDNTTNATVINILSFTSNPRTDTWQFSQLPVAASNTVTPTTRTQWGTYGRFFHMPEYKCLGVYNSVSQPIYTYRYE
jgi:hypothetical protein